MRDYRFTYAHHQPLYQGSDMPTFLNRYATPLTIGLFLVSLISGIALFFHIQSGLFKSMHEWLSLVLIIPVGLHIWKNWRPMLGYLKRAPLAIALVLSLAASGIFMANAAMSGRTGGNPAIALIGKLQQNSVESVAPLFGYTTDGLVEALTAKGFTVTSADQTLAEITKASQKGPFDVAAVLAGR
ncbi:DUF4405 domain-containing protein [Breoghania sp.]|uniref:DUF4405 domain-containing protein n=1 Tax=Breoghania sp. TaxID=2065378 RepID=UPI002AAA709C|nr:DUF4405 domain-containing protein [Breoghania sp.]